MSRFRARKLSLNARISATALLVIAVAFIASCDCESCKAPETSGKTTDKAPVTAPAADAPKPDAVYTFRARIEELPDAAKPVSEFVVHHEAIDDFKGPSGDIVGMGSMSMPLPLGKGVSSADLKVGDIVELVLEHYLKPSLKVSVVKITKLPDDTKLEFREKRPVK